jgi:hypothetical protein
MFAGSTLRRLAVPGALVLGGLVFAGPAQALVRTDTDADVATLRAAASKYQDVKAAVADGFTPTDDCTSSPQGVMGYHYVHPKRLGTPSEVAKPPILVYQPDGAGGRKLVAVEYFKPDADQNLSTTEDRPTLFGKPFDGPMEGHSPGMPRHYDLHAWLWQDNPNGMFASWNPAGSCKGATKADPAMDAGKDATAMPSGMPMDAGMKMDDKKMDAAMKMGADQQVSKTPSGGANTGGGSTAATDESWLVGLGLAATAAGVVLFGAGARARRQS